MKQKGHSQLHELQDISLAHLELFEGNYHLDVTEKVLYKILLFPVRME
jgi:hypothetical protein